MSPPTEEYYDVQTPCKVCGQIVTTSCHKDCPDDWRNKLLPLVTCERCMRVYATDVRNRIVRDNARQELERKNEQPPEPPLPEMEFDSDSEPF